MTNNPPPTRSTTNDDRIAALEVSDHSIRRQIEVQGEEFAKEFIDIKESVEALANAIAQMGRRIEGMNSHREEGSASRNRGNGENSASRNHGSEGTNGGTVGGIQTRFSRVDFPQFNGEDPTGSLTSKAAGSTRQKNSFVINGQKIVRRSLWLPSICWMMLFNGTSGLRKQGQMFHGRNLHMLCMSVSGHQIMKTLMKL